MEQWNAGLPSHRCNSNVNFVRDENDQAKGYQQSDLGKGLNSKQAETMCGARAGTKDYFVQEHPNGNHVCGVFDAPLQRSDKPQKDGGMNGAVCYYQPYTCRPDQHRAEKKAYSTTLLPIKSSIEDANLECWKRANGHDYHVAQDKWFRITDCGAYHGKVHDNDKTVTYSDTRFGAVCRNNRT